VLRIEAATISTGIKKRDAHLRSTDFFAVDEYPQVRFELASLVRNKDRAYTATGTLHIRDLAFPIKTPVSVATLGSGGLRIVADLDVDERVLGVEFERLPRTTHVHAALTLQRTTHVSRGRSGSVTATSHPTLPVRRWGRAWLHSDLIGIPFTLAVFAIIVISVGLYLVLGKVAGLFVGKLLFILALGGLLGLVLLLEGRRGETTEGVSKLPADAPRRVLVIANEGLQNLTLLAELCDHGKRVVSEALLVVPVVASSRLHALADDVDRELHAAQQRLDAGLDTLRRVGIKAAGHTDIGQPMSSLLDGLREFPATEVVMLRGGERGWEKAERFAERVRTELDLPVTEVGSTPPASRAA
jgi:hypothetical protein